MYTYQDLKAKFPGCYSVGGDVIARVENQNVTVAELGNGSFNLTKKGQELMGEPKVKVTATVEAEVITHESKPRGRKPKVVDPVQEPDTLDTILGE